jgi:hypothetical protein
VKSARFALPVFCLVLFVAVTAIRADDGFSFPNLNPFAAKKTDAKPAKTRVSDQSARAPVMSPRKPSEPSTWEKMGTGTKNFFTKTGEVLMPWKTPSTPAPAQVSPTGTRRSYSGSSMSKKPEPKKKSLFSSWFGGEEEPQQQMDVNEFLAQPRPGF